MQKWHLYSCCVNFLIEVHFTNKNTLLDAKTYLILSGLNFKKHSRKMLKFFTITL